MSAYTPGPWKIIGRTVYALNERGFNRFTARVEDAHTASSERVANARLMAAAPEMLEALQLIASTDHVDAALDPQRAARIAREGIAKTTGDKS